MGAWDGYYSLGGTEIANEERFRSYVQNVAPWLPMPERALDEYEGTHIGLGDPAYTNPTDDRAPWVDLDDPVTSDFLGMTVLSIEGLEDSQTGATATESLGKGASVGLPRDSSREIRVTGLLVGLTPEAVQAGYTWLHRALWRGKNPRPLVPQMPGVSDLRFFAQRPDIDESVVVNRVLNPSATGLGESLVGADGTAYAFRALDNSGNWAYKLTYRQAASTGEAFLVPAQRALAVPGTQWVARARIWRSSAVTGTRTVRLYLRFRDQYGNPILAVGKKDTTLPDDAGAGVLYRWSGARYDSYSQRLTTDGMITNWIVNPSAEGTRLGVSALNGSTKVALTGTTTFSPGKKAYMVTAMSTSPVVAQSQIVRTTEGRQWWGRAVGKLATLGGARTVRADIQWLDSSNKEIGKTLGTPVTMTPTGTYTRWTGAAANSRSERFSGATKQTNWNTNPSVSRNITGYTGRNATAARERIVSNAFGTQYVVRVTPTNTSGVVTGVTLPFSVPKGTVVNVTFKIQVLGSGGSAQYKLTGTGWKAVTAGSETFTAGTAPTLITIPVQITGNQPDQILRIARVSNSNTRPFRVTQFGYVDGGGSFFDGNTSPSGQKANTAQFSLSVGDVAPDDTAGARLLLTTTKTSALTVGDKYLFDRIMFTQADAPSDGTDDGSNPQPAVMPAYFDGDSVSTYTPVASATITSTDTSKQDVVVTAEAPDGAVTAEIAVSREAGNAVAGDTFYADNLMLADYDPDEGVPDYTSFTRHDAISETERWMQEVYPIAGPTTIQDIELDCKGAATQVEFTLNATNPTWLRDNGDTVALPLPSQVSGTTGAGAFALIEDKNGIVRNYMPQFSISSPLVPTSWVTTNSNGSIEVKGVKPNSAAPYVLYVRVGPTGTIWNTTISAISVLGSRGGSTAAIASIWVGCTQAKDVKITAYAYNGSTLVKSMSLSPTLSVSANGDILGNDASFRYDFNLGSIPTADGFRFKVEGPSDPVITYIGNPQVTLGSTTYPLINGNLPDDGTYTYDFDAAGFSRRTPVKNVRSHTIFANMTAPPIAVSGLAGYDEVGLTTYRTYAAIPAEIVPRNADAVPVVRVDFDAFITRWVRFRFYPNPMNLPPEQVPTYTYDTEWVVDLQYANVKGYNSTSIGYTSLVIDGVARRTWLRALDGTVIPGDQFVTTSEGSPIKWPELRDIPYVVSVEYPAFKQANEPSGEGWWRASMALMIEE